MGNSFTYRIFKVVLTDDEGFIIIRKSTGEVLEKNLYFADELEVMKYIDKAYF